MPTRPSCFFHLGAWNVTSKRDFHWGVLLVQMEHVGTFSGGIAEVVRCSEFHSIERLALVIMLVRFTGTF